MTQISQRCCCPLAKLPQRKFPPLHSDILSSAIFTSGSGVSKVMAIGSGLISDLLKATPLTPESFGANRLSFLSFILSSIPRG